MGILSGPAIVARYFSGDIEIDPFIIGNVGQNSIDLRLGKVLLEMLDDEFDMTKQVEIVNQITIPPEGYLLKKGVGYLGSTMERVCCRGPYVPWIDGRSTAGRYFLQVHQTAGRGDQKFYGAYTLEMMAVHRPVRIYAGLPIAQMTFMDMTGQSSERMSRYNGQQGPRLPSPLELPEYPQ